MYTTVCITMLGMAERYALTDKGGTDIAKKRLSGKHLRCRLYYHKLHTQISLYTCQSPALDGCIWHHTFRQSAILLKIIC